MSLAITISNQVKCYNLSVCPTLPQFLEEAYKTQKSLKHNELYRKRIEVIQDFDFPTACTQVEETQDQQYIVAAGVYAPSIKIFETSQLSMKCMRGLDSEIVKFCMLGSDYKKVAMALADRNIELHAQYGKHYRTRVPKMPTDMVFNPFTCDLIVSSSSNELVRLSLDQGQFLSSVECLGETGVYGLDYSPEINVLYAAGNNYLNAIDYRQRAVATQLGTPCALSCVKANGLQVATGNQDGLVSLYDVRQSKPFLKMQHQYRLPIRKIAFNTRNNMIVSADQKILKFFHQNTGQLFTSIEPTSEINSFSNVQDSGVYLIAQEHPRIGIYFIPQLDPAPKWCPFIENITEELEEQDNHIVYDDFKFLTLAQLEELEASNLIDTKYVKQYMHGFLMHVKLYNKMAEEKGIQIEDHKEQQVQKKLKKDREVEKQSKGYLPEQSKEINEDFKETQVDPRFSMIFKDENYQIDKTSEMYKRLHPSEKGVYGQQVKKGAKKQIQKPQKKKAVKKQK